MDAVSTRRWQLAQEGQLQGQRRKREHARGHEQQLLEGCRLASTRVAHLLSKHGFVATADDCVVEVGSGSHGLIWCWPEGHRYGVDPLASFYREHFAFLQDGPVQSIDGQGEALPFADASVYLLLSDNVIDHARDPRAFIQECRRVLRPDGALYLTFDVHHPIWDLGARIYNRLSDAGLSLRIPAFPNHPFHFRTGAVESLLRAAELTPIWRKQPQRPAPLAKPSDLIKRAFFKNRRVSLLVTPAGS